MAQADSVYDRPANARRGPPLLERWFAEKISRDGARQQPSRTREREGNCLAASSELAFEPVETSPQAAFEGPFSRWRQRPSVRFSG